MSTLIAPHEPQRPEEPEERPEVRCEPGDDGVRHDAVPPAGGGAFHTGTARESLPPFVAPVTVVQHTSPASGIAGGVCASVADLSAFGSKPHGATAIHSEPAGNETCPACLGRRVVHFGQCRTCGGSGSISRDTCGPSSPGRDTSVATELVAGASVAPFLLPLAVFVASNVALAVLS